MHGPSAPIRSAFVVAVLLLALLPLPGAQSLWTSVLVGVWAIPPCCFVVAVVTRHVIGIVQPLAHGLAAGSRAPPPAFVPSPVI